MSYQISRRIVTWLVWSLALAALISALVVRFQDSLPQLLPPLDNAPTNVPSMISRSAGAGDERAAGFAVDEALKKAREQLAPARLNYTRPNHLAVGERTDVLVGLIPLGNRTSPEADQQLGEAFGQSPETFTRVTIDASTVMIAELIGSPDGFRIKALHHRDRQVLMPDRPTEWAWDVMAIAPGKHDLTLTLTAVIRAGGQEESLTQTYRDKIPVRIDPVITGSYLAHRYWLPLLLLLLAVSAAFVAKLAYRFWFRRQKQLLQATISVADPAPGRGYLFISYSRRDETFAIPLARDLMNGGLRVWLDQREIKPGEDWVAHIERGVDRTDAMVVVLSPPAVASPHVAKEIELALAAGKPVFPLFHRRCEAPAALQRIDIVDFTKDYRIGFGRLVSGIRRWKSGDSS